MLMSMSILNDTVKLLTNINNGTNTLVINNSIVPESSWVGTGYYTVGNIRIAKISANSGNVHLIKVNDLNYKLVVKTNTSVIWAENVSYDNTVSGSTEDDVQGAIDDLYDKVDEKTTQLDALKAVYPVGAVYMSTTNTNPNTLFGFGTWERISGKFLLGVTDNATNTGYSQAVTKTGGVTGGSVTLGSTNIPYHTHSIGTNVISNALSVTVDNGGAHNHSYRDYWTIWQGSTQTSKHAVSYDVQGDADLPSDRTTAYGSTHSHTITKSSTAVTPSYYGGNSSHNTVGFDIRPPFFAVYIWRRTA